MTVSSLRTGAARLPFLKFVTADFVRHGAIVFGAGMLLNVCNYLFHFYMTRQLGPSTYGLLSSLLALSSILSLPSGILAIVIVKYASELSAVDDAPKLRALLENSLALSVAAALLLFVVCFACAPFIAGYLRERDTVAVVLVALGVALGLFNPALRGVLQGTQRFSALAGAIAIEGIGKCVAGIGLAAAGFGLRGALAGYVLACAVSVVYAFAVCRRYRGAPKGSLRIDYRRLLQSFLGVGIATAMLQIASYFDVVLVKHYFPPAQAGVYSGVALAGKVMLFIVAFVPAIVLPKAAAHTARGERAAPMFWQGLALTLVVSFGCLAVMFVAPAFVMRVFSGTGYLSGAQYLPLYALAMTFLATASLVANYQIALHKFAFIVPLVAAFVMESALVSIFHGSIHTVVTIVTCGNAALLGAVTFLPARARLLAALREAPGALAE